MEANDEAFFDIPVEISSDLDRKIYDAFKVYDFRCVNMVDASDIGNILRFLGCVPLVVIKFQMWKLSEIERRSKNFTFLYASCIYY